MQVFSRITDVNIKIVVRLWVENPDLATAEYGHIRYWNTSAVTDMREFFTHKYLFNDDISGWDVSHVTDMGYMFNGARMFNQDLMCQE